MLVINLTKVCMPTAALGENFSTNQENQINQNKTEKEAKRNF